MRRRRFVSVDGGSEDLSYFVQWRPYLWLRPVARALESLGDLTDKRVLEIGGGPGRMTALMALMGAKVTMIDRVDLAPARQEVDKWGVSDSVRLIQTQGGLEELGDQQFDVILTKSVLWCIEQLDDLLADMDAHLAPGGRVAFIENYRGHRLLFWLRRNVLRRGRFNYESHYFGITQDQLDLFRRRFDDVSIKRHRWLVYTILGRKHATGE